MPAWISAAAAVIAAIGGIVFGVASLASSDSKEAASTTTTSSTFVSATPDGKEPALSPPRIVTVREAPPPIVSASGTATNLPSDARIYLGVRTVPSTDSQGSQASRAETAAWELSTRGSTVDDRGAWKIAEFAVPESVDEPYEFFAVATTSGFVGAISNAEGATPPPCPSFTEPVAGGARVFGCEVAKSRVVPYRSSTDS
jgi:hypothetical protein